MNPATDQITRRWRFQSRLAMSLLVEAGDFIPGDGDVIEGSRFGG